MGWEVFATGSVDFNTKVTDSQIRKIAKELKDDEFMMKCEPDVKNKYISIEMSGNKGIDYSHFEEIMKKHKDLLSGDVSLGEYSETGDGFYYDPQNEEGDGK